ncbi:MAG: hypothetical protein ACOCWO_03670, partial [Candidatus Muiribacteriaceae bacterium]
MKTRILIIVILIKAAILMAASSFEVLETEHFRIYVSDSLEERFGHITDVFEKNYERFSELFDTEVPGRIEVKLYDGYIGAFGETDPVGSDISMTCHSDVPQGITFEILAAHELMHVFQFHIFKKGKGFPLDLFNMAFIPMWIYEGYAEFFSRPYDIFYESRINMYPEYTPVEMQIFYNRDQMNRSGGYFYSHLFIKYLSERYGIDKIRGFLKKISSARHFFRVFSKEFGQFNKVYNDFIEHVRAGKNITLDTHEEIVTTHGRSCYSPVVYGGKVAFLSLTRDFGLKDLYVLENNKTVKIRDQVHSIDSIQDKLLLSVLYRSGSGITYRIFYDGKYTGFDGMYASISGDRICFSEGKGVFHVFNTDKKNRILSVACDYACLSGDSLFYISDNRLMLKKLTEPEKEVELYTAENIFPFIRAYNNKVIISCHDGEGFVNRSVSETGETELLFRGYGRCVFISDRYIYYEKYHKGKTVII